MNEQEINYLHQVAERLGYSDIEKLLADIAKLEEYCPSIGVSIYNGKPEDFKHPLLDLGLIELMPIKAGSSSNWIYASRKGLDILDGLRKVRGQETIEKRNLKVLDEIERANRYLD